MSKKVLVIGELNVDLIVTGLPSLPVLGQELTCTGLSRALGSSSAIFSRALAGLGAQVDFMGKVGDDDNGHFMVAQLQEVGIGTQGVIIDPSVQTGVTISLTYPEEKAQITYLGSIADYSLADVNLDVLGDYDHLHMASMYLQRGLRPAFPELLRQAKMCGLTTSLDPGWDQEEEWDGGLFKALSAVDILFVNEHEVKAIGKSESIRKASMTLARQANMVIARLGAEGAWLTGQDGTTLESPAFPVEVVDTTGAGDSFNAGFIYQYVVKGSSKPEALRFANACGALAVTRVGGASSVPSASEVEAFLAELSNDEDTR
ncbi:MAG: PfkB family carbohydrate kinase [Anaerolineae bacterium]